MSAPAEVPRPVPEQEAARWLGLSVVTLRRYRLQGGGPKFARIGRKAVYYLADLDAWVRSTLANSNAEARARVRREAVSHVR